MKAKRNHHKYRQIWEQAYGPIPKDSDGNSYEIHHIDGDKTNNELSNLACLSMKQHYDTHYSLGDYGAAFLIANRMTKKPEEISYLASKAGKFGADKLLALGTHNFQLLNRDSEWRAKLFYSTPQGKEVRRELNAKMYKSGANSFFDSAAAKERQSKLIAEGRHNLQGGTTCRDKSGKVVQIPTDEYHNQSGNKDDWEYVSINSKEGKRRKLL